MRENDSAFDGIITTLWPVLVFVVVIFFGLARNKQPEPAPDQMENVIERAE